MNTLLVEDDLDLGNGVRIALVDDGMDVVWVRRLDDAMRLLSAGTFETVLLDLGLPDGCGGDLMVACGGTAGCCRC